MIQFFHWTALRTSFPPSSLMWRPSSGPSERFEPPGAIAAIGKSEEPAPEAAGAALRCGGS